LAQIDLKYDLEKVLLSPPARMTVREENMTIRNGMKTHGPKGLLAAVSLLGASLGVASATPSDAPSRSNANSFAGGSVTRIAETQTTKPKYQSNQMKMKSADDTIKLKDKKAIEKSAIGPPFKKQDVKPNTLNPQPLPPGPPPPSRQ